MQKTMSEYYILHDFPTYKQYSTYDYTSGEPQYIDYRWDDIHNKWLTYYNWCKFDDLRMVMINADDSIYWRDNSGGKIVSKCKKL